jgi:hypothetical protein
VAAGFGRDQRIGVDDEHSGAIDALGLLQRALEL